MRFKNLLDGDFPPEYRKIYMERVRRALKNADKYVDVKITKKQHVWSGDPTHKVEFSWNVANTFFAYYDMLTPEEQEELSTLANKALKKIDVEFRELENKLTPDIKFEVHIDYSLLFAVTHTKFKYRFYDWIKKAVGERYNYLNSREYLKTVNNRDALRQFQDDIKQTLELLNYLKAFEN